MDNKQVNLPTPISNGQPGQPGAGQDASAPSAPMPAASQPQQDDTKGHVVAEDQDVIEKQWVDIAKGIVEKTKHDPKMQADQIEKFKAGYIKKRYDIDMKTNEDS